MNAVADLVGLTSALTSGRPQIRAAVWCSACWTAVAARPGAILRFQDTTDAQRIGSALKITPAWLLMYANPQGSAMSLIMNQ